MRGGPAIVTHVIRHPAVIASFAAFALALVLLGAIAVLVWHPAQQEAAEAGAQLDQVAAEIRDLRYRARLAQDYSLRVAQTEALEAKLAQAKSEPAFIQGIEALAARSGAAAEQISSRSDTSRSEERRSAIGAAYFELILKGSYTNVRQFIAGLPELKEFVSIERVSLERDGEAVRAYLVMKRRNKAG